MGSLAGGRTRVYSHPLVDRGPHGAALHLLQPDDRQGGARIDGTHLFHDAAQANGPALCLVQGGAGGIHPRGAEQHRLRDDDAGNQHALARETEEEEPPCLREARIRPAARCQQGYS